MKKSINDMKFGADAEVVEAILPGIEVPNSRNLEKPELGSVFSDKIADWISKNYVMGPYHQPPLPDFRSNSMFALEQGHKIRPIVNLSAPAGQSFNEAVLDLPSVEMASSKQVAQQIYKHGYGCLLCKLDMVDAYKLIPLKPSQWRLMGFKWLGKYFIEKRQVFGSRSAVSNYDVFHFVVSLICRVLTDTPKEDVPRVLDDQMVIGMHPTFIDTYLQLAKEVNIPLAPMDDGKKAFVYKTSGTMLGIHFNTKAMTWSLPKEKAQKYMYDISCVTRDRIATLKELQSINGYLNVIITHAPILKCWRAPLIIEIIRAENKPQGILLRNEVINCLNNWLRIIEDLSVEGFPITPPPEYLPDFHFVLDSDAAGLAIDEQLKFDIGAGYVLAKHQGKILSTGQVFWDRSFIQSYDNQGRFFGCKTTTLECAAFIYPLYHNRTLIKNSRVLIFVDNSAVMYAFDKGRSGSDPYVTFLVQAILFVMTQLCCLLTVRHVKRRSSPTAKIADTLSRDNEEAKEMITDLKSFRKGCWPHAMIDWFKNPSFDPNFKRKLLDEFLL